MCAQADTDGRAEETLALVALLDEHREELATFWVAEIRRQLSQSSYGQRPAQEIYANNLIAIDTMRDLALGSDPLTSWRKLERDTHASLTYVQIGIQVSELVDAALLFRDVVRPFVAHATLTGTIPAQVLEREMDACIRRFAVLVVEHYSVRVRQYLEAQQRRTALMLEITRQVSTTLELGEVLRQAAEGIARAVGAVHCLLYLVGDEDGTDVVWTAVFSPATAERMRDSLCDAAPSSRLSVTSLVAETRRPFVCHDVQADPAVDREMARALGVRSLLALPISLKDRVLAVAVVVTFDQGRAFTSEEIELASGVGNAVAPAIENARLYRKVEQLAVMEERARLAREIHDDLAQMLGAMQLKASLASALLSYGRATQAEAALLELQDLISQAYASVREAIFNLRAVVSPELGFFHTLHEYLTDYRTYYGLDVHLEATEEAAVVLAGNTGAQVIRIIQEALTNARKHARATQAWVRIEQDGGGVCISVEDDGQGFDPSRASGIDQPHFGLRIMRERAEKVRGSLDVDSRPDSGTRVMLRLPGASSGGGA
jgi:two-component system nitrate/nitrite sensor histidine kinase NarX